jgi:diaminopimelate decarboxylase
MLGGMRVSAAIEGTGQTPTYVYDLGAIEAEAVALQAAFDSHAGGVFFAVKANSAGPIVRALASRGCGADVVSGGELALALACDLSAESIVFSGVAKTDEELDLAISSGPRGIRAIQIESIEEIARVDARARAAGRVVRMTIRVNPGLDIEELATHAHVATGHDEAKFGVAKGDLEHALAQVTASKNVTLVGISSHVGSQLFATAPYLAAARITFEMARGVRTRFPLELVDTGGGFGVDYTGANPVRPADFVRETLALMRDAQVDDLGLHVEPGRALVARHGVLVARVIQRKVSPSTPTARWLLIDAGMNDLIRPALYQAKHRIVPLVHASGPTHAWRVVGPICESADDFGAHELPDEGFDTVAILDAGAYGYTMASRYNGRALPSEVFIREGRVVATAARAPMMAWARERATMG